MKVKLDAGAYMPFKEYELDAGYDLRTPKHVSIWPGDSAVIDTGVHIELEPGTYIKLESKSGLNVNHGVVSLGGVIDAGYTGSMKVKLYNFGRERYDFEAGDKIVQMIIMHHDSPVLELAEELEETERGNNGFGSTGK